MEQHSSHKTIILSIAIVCATVGFLGFVGLNKHYQMISSFNTVLSDYKTKEYLEAEFMNPFTHCIKITMSESRQSGKIIDVKEARDICIHLEKKREDKN